MLFWIKPLLCLLLLASQPTFAWDPDTTAGLFQRLLRSEYARSREKHAVLEAAAKETRLHAYWQRLLSQRWDNDPEAVNYFHWISATLETTPSLGPIQSPTLWTALNSSDDVAVGFSYRLHLRNQIAFSMAQHPPAYLGKDVAIIWLLEQKGPLNWYSLAYMNAFSEWKKQMREKINETKEKRKLDEQSKNLLQMLDSIERAQTDDLDLSSLEKISDHRFIRFFLNQLVLSMTPQLADKLLKSKLFFKFINEIAKQDYFRQDYADLFALSVQLFRNTSGLKDKLKAVALVLGCVQGGLSDADKNLNPINLKVIQELFGEETNPAAQTFQSLEHLANFYDEAEREELHSLKGFYLNTAKTLVAHAKLYRTTAFIKYIHDPLTSEFTARISLKAFDRSLLLYFEDIPKLEASQAMQPQPTQLEDYDSRFMMKVACIAALTGGAVYSAPYILRWIFTP